MANCSLKHWLAARGGRGIGEGRGKEWGEEEEREVVAAESFMGGMCGILPGTQECHRTASPLLIAG